MNVEGLCKKVQYTQKTDSNGYYEEMSSHDYLEQYFDAEQFSVRKFLRLVQEERRHRNRRI